MYFQDYSDENAGMPPSTTETLISSDITTPVTATTLDTGDSWEKTTSREDYTSVQNGQFCLLVFKTITVWNNKYWNYSIIIIIKIFTDK
jgi:hypothetical protein